MGLLCAGRNVKRQRTNVIFVTLPTEIFTLLKQMINLIKDLKKSCKQIFRTSDRAFLRIGDDSGSGTTTEQGYSGSGMALDQGPLRSVTTRYQGPFRIRATSNQVLLLFGTMGEEEFHYPIFVYLSSEKSEQRKL